MKPLWIRVEARKLSSTVIGQLADAIEDSPVHALGHYVALGGEVAEHTVDGDISDVSDATIERWAVWTGPRGVFAQAVREHLAKDGVFDDWRNSMGKLVATRLSDRARKAPGVSTENTPGSTEIPGKPPDLPRSFHGNTPDFHGNSVDFLARPPARPGAADVTERNGTVSAKEIQSGSGDLQAAAAPRRVVADDFKGTAVEGWFTKFYPKDSAAPPRRADVMEQLLATLNDGARAADGGLVFAYTLDRLARKCREMCAGNPMADRDKAIVVLLIKLGDTSDGSAPGVADAKAIAEQSDLDARQHAHDLTTAQAWIAGNPDARADVDALIAADPIADGPLAPNLRRFQREGLVLTAWRTAQTAHAARASPSGSGGP